MEMQRYSVLVQYLFNSKCWLHNVMCVLLELIGFWCSFFRSSFFLNMAIKVLLLGFYYIYMKRSPGYMDRFIVSFFFHQRLLHLRYKSSEMCIIVDQVNDVLLTSSSSSPSETRVEDIVNPQQVLNSVVQYSVRACPRCLEAHDI
jgi:hypothetical protein